MNKLFSFFNLLYGSPCNCSIQPELIPIPNSLQSRSIPHTPLPLFYLQPHFPTTLYFAERFSSHAGSTVRLTIVETIVDKERVARHLVRPGTKRIRRTSHGTTFTPSAEENNILLRINSVHGTRGQTNNSYVEWAPILDDIPRKLNALHSTAF